MPYQDTALPLSYFNILENEIGFEPMNTGVADQRLIRLATHSMYKKMGNRIFTCNAPYDSNLL